MKAWLRYGIVALVACIAATVATCANADTLRGNKTSCEHFAGYVVQVGGMRDQGVPWEVMKPHLQSKVDEARQFPESYVQNDADAEFVMAAFEAVWKMPSESLVVIAARVYNSCMNTAHYPINKVQNSKRVMV